MYRQVATTRTRPGGRGGEASQVDVGRPAGLGGVRQPPTRSTLAGFSAASVLELQRQTGNRAMAGVLGTSLQRQGAGKPTLTMGSRGPAVSALQAALNSSGANLTADGKFGPATLAAVKAFQSASGLAADGIVGPKTWGRLQGSGGVAQGTAAGGADGTAAAVAKQLALIRTALATIRAQRKGGPAASGGKAVPERATASPPAGAWGRDDEGSWLDDVGDAVGGVVDSVGEKVGGAAEWAGEKAGEAADWVGEKTGEAADWIGEKTGEVADWVGDKVGGAAEWVGEKTGEVISTVTDMAGEGYDAVVSGINDVKDELGQLGDDFREALGPVYDALVEAIGTLGKPLTWGGSMLDTLNGILKKLGDLLPGDPGPGEEDRFLSGETGPIPGGVVPGTAGCDAAPGRLARGRPAVRRLPLSAALSLDPTLTRGPPTGGPMALDKTMAGNVEFSSKITPGDVFVPKTAFGYAQPTFNIASSLWKASTSWSYVNVDVPMLLEVNWNLQDPPTKGFPRIKIFKATDNTIHAGSWKSIVKDLRPDGKGVPERWSYYVPQITMEHELAHANDYISRAKAYLPEALAWLNSKEVDVHWYSTQATVNKEVRALLVQLEEMFRIDALKHYEAGGEDRAYQATRGGYDTLVSEIDARATANGWK